MSKREEFSQQRRFARELALQALYQLEINKDKVKVGFKKFIDVYNPVLEENVFNYIEKLVIGTMSRIGVIDRVIKKKLENWTIERITLVDKCILRYSIYEICEIDAIPRIVSINEAIEIAKKFGTSESGKFINGILDNINSNDIKDELEIILKKKNRKKKGNEDVLKTIQKGEK